MKPAYIYLISLFIIPLLPNAMSIDVIGVHWFALSILNSAYTLYFLIFHKVFSLKSFLNFKPYIFLSFFIFFCAISLIFTRNINLSIVDFSRVLNIFLSIIFLTNLFKDKINFYNISLIFSFFLIVDLITTYLPYINLSLKSSTSFLNLLSNNFDPAYLKGFTGNKNINAAYILIKVPFLLYFISNSKHLFYKFFSSFLLLLIITTIFLIKSRAAYLSLFCISFFFTFDSFIYQRRNLIFIPIFIFGFLFSSFILQNTKSSSVINEVKSIQFSDASSQGRLSLWENTLEASLSNNFIGLGIGSWKIESLPYWNKNGTDYMVPYHAHNDFLELLTEIGLFGSLAYLLIFLYSFYLIFSSFLKSKSLIDLCIFSSLLVYFIDANLNFPLERYTMQFIFAFLMFLIHNTYEKNKINY